MNAAAYLERIGYHGGLEPSIGTLRGLHRAHMLAVPFENLDIHLGRPIVLEEERLFEKIVVGGRGGFCYELNGLFAGLLRRLGYRVEMHSAPVARKAGGFGPEFDHLALVVELESRWLTDIGFGDSFCEPLRLGETAIQEQDGRAYRMEDEVLYRLEDENVWAAQYRLSPEARKLSEFEGMCLHHQTSPDSSFTRSRVCTLATPEGRITLTDSRWIVTAGGHKTERPVESEAEFRELLRKHFGILYDKKPR